MRPAPRRRGVSTTTTSCTRTRTRTPRGPLISIKVVLNGKIGRASEIVMMILLKLRFQVHCHGRRGCLLRGWTCVSGQLLLDRPAKERRLSFVPKSEEQYTGQLWAQTSGEDFHNGGSRDDSGLGTLYGIIVYGLCSTIGRGGSFNCLFGRHLPERLFTFASYMCLTGYDSYAGEVRSEMFYFCCRAITDASSWKHVPPSASFRSGRNNGGPTCRSGRATSVSDHADLSFDTTCHR